MKIGPANLSSQGSSRPPLRKVLESLCQRDEIRLSGEKRRLFGGTKLTDLSPKEASKRLEKGNAEVRVAGPGEVPFAVSSPTQIFQLAEILEHRPDEPAERALVSLLDQGFKVEDSSLNPITPLAALQPSAENSIWIRKDSRRSRIERADDLVALDYFSGSGQDQGLAKPELAARLVELRRQGFSFVDHSLLDTYRKGPHQNLRLDFRGERILVEPAHLEDPALFEERRNLCRELHERFIEPSQLSKFSQDDFLRGYFDRQHFSRRGLSLDAWAEAVVQACQGMEKPSFSLADRMVRTLEDCVPPQHFTRLFNTFAERYQAVGGADAGWECARLSFPLDGESLDQRIELYLKNPAEYLNQPGSDNWNALRFFQGATEQPPAHEAVALNIQALQEKYQLSVDWKDVPHRSFQADPEAWIYRFAQEDPDRWLELENQDQTSIPLKLLGNPGAIDQHMQAAQAIWDRNLEPHFRTHFRLREERRVMCREWVTHPEREASFSRLAKIFGAPMNNDDDVERYKKVFRLHQRFPQAETELKALAQTFGPDQVLSELPFYGRPEALGLLARLGPDLKKAKETVKRLAEWTDLESLKPDEAPSLARAVAEFEKAEAFDLKPDLQVEIPGLEVGRRAELLLQALIGAPKDRGALLSHYARAASQETELSADEILARILKQEPAQDLSGDIKFEQDVVMVDEFALEYQF